MENGGTAFPTVEHTESGYTYTETTGMTLRDYFAARALIMFEPPQRDEEVESLAKWSYQIADAMIKARH